MPTRTQNCFLLTAAFSNRHLSFLALLTLLSVGCATGSQRMFGLSRDAKLDSVAQIRWDLDDGPLWLLEGVHEDSVHGTTAVSLLHASREAGISSKWHKTVKVVYTPIATKVDTASALVPSGDYTFISRSTKITTSKTETDSEVITAMALLLIQGVKELDAGRVYQVSRYNKADGTQGISVTELASP